MSGQPFRIIACGGRDMPDSAPVYSALDTVLAGLSADERRSVVLVHGACGWDADDPATWIPSRLRGADRWADGWALSRLGLARLERVAAAWRTELPGAGPRRNGRMLAMGADLVVAFPGGSGTADMVRQATRAGVRICRASRGEHAAVVLEWSEAPTPRQASLFTTSGKDDVMIYETKAESFDRESLQDPEQFARAAALFGLPMAEHIRDSEPGPIGRYTAGAVQGGTAPITKRLAKR